MWNKIVATGNIECSRSLLSIKATLRVIAYNAMTEESCFEGNILYVHIFIACRMEDFLESPCLPDLPVCSAAAPSLSRPTPPSPIAPGTHRLSDPTLHRWMHRMSHAAISKWPTFQYDELFSIVYWCQDSATQCCIWQVFIKLKLIFTKQWIPPVISIKLKHCSTLCIQKRH